MRNDQGTIRKALSGFYYVQTDDGLVTCRARGKFRYQKITPLVGDRVAITVQDDGSGSLDHILPRRNAFQRPAVANLDQLVIIASGAIPVSDPFLLDRIISLAESKECQPILCINKWDLVQAEDLLAIYQAAGIPTLSVSAATGQGIEELRGLLAGKISAFTGNSGVGKSSLMNSLFPQLGLETGIISKKLGRGKHTTRQAQLYRLSELDPAMTGYAADTPGFSTVDTERYCRIPAGELDNSFREFAKFAEKCRFADCAHIKEKDCAVRAAAESGEIAKSRYESYLRMHEEARKINDWE